MHQVIMILRIILVVLVCVTEAVSKTDLEMLLVEDHLICKHHSVVLDVDGTKEVPAFNFAANTLGFSEIRIRRAEMNPYSCGIDRSNEFGKAAVFCCEDVGQELYVELTGLNAKKEARNCMIKVDVFIGGTLNVDFCLPDLIVDCSTPVDLNNLSNFGKFVKNPSHQQPIILNGEQVGMDGLIQFKCSSDDINPKKISIDEIVTVEETLGCGQGYTITRKMRLIDRGGVMSECTQLITVKPDITPLTYHDIIWPSDTTIYGCVGTDADPVLLGEPITTAADCENVLVSYEDELLNTIDAGCTKLIRRWSVLDWCAYEFNGNGSGKWDHTQVIRIESTIKPEITNCHDLDICINENSCEAVLFYTIEATDECHPAEELYYSYNLFLNGDDDNGRSGRSRTVNEYLPIGEHVLYWSVNDGCNNIQSCSHRITVTDCKAPSIFCITGFTGTLVDTGVNGEPSLEIWANDFIKKTFDNCTPEEDLVISLSADTSDQVVFYDCQNIGLNEIEIFVTDPQGQQSSCITSFHIMDNNNICGEAQNEGQLIENEAASAMIQGLVTGESGNPIENVTLELSGPEMNDKRSTDLDGSYQFDNIPMHTDYMLTASKSNYSREGISVLDLVLLQQHILGLKEFDSPYKMIAGDVDHSGHISVTDLVQLKSYLVHLTDEFDNQPWRFLDKEFQFVDIHDPWPFTEESAISKLENENMFKHFIGVKIGDVDHTVSNNSNNSKSRFGEQFTAQVSNAGTKISVDFAQQKPEALYIRWKSKTLDHIEATSGQVSNDDLSIIKSNEDYIYRLIVYTNESQYVDISIMEISTSGQFMSLVADVVSKDLEEFPIHFETVPDKAPQFSIGPNPFDSELTISYNEPIKQKAEIQLFSVDGRLIFRHNMPLTKFQKTYHIQVPGIQNHTIIFARILFDSGLIKTQKLIHFE